MSRVSISFLKYFSLLIGSFIALFPLVVVLLASLKTREEFSRGHALSLPENWLNFENYKRAFIEGNMLLGFVNTIIILIISITGAILLSSMIAYVLTRFNLKGGPFIIGLFLFAALIPGVTTQVATFQIINDLGLFNTRASAILIFMGTDIISVYIFIQFLSRISMELDESAMIDGASYLTIFRKIVFPLLKPAIATVIIIKGVAIYNDFYIPFLYMPKAELQVVSTALFKFKGPYGTEWEMISAGVIIVIIPTLLIFLSLQKYIYNGFTQGSIK